MLTTSPSEKKNVSLCDVNLCDINLCDVKPCDVSVCVCVNRYNKRSIFRLLVTNQFAGGWSIIQMSPSNEDASVA